MLTSLPILIQQLFWWSQSRVRYRLFVCCFGFGLVSVTVVAVKLLLLLSLLLPVFHCRLWAVAVTTSSHFKRLGKGSPRTVLPTPLKLMNSVLTDNSKLMNSQLINSDNFPTDEVLPDAEFSR